MITVTCGKNTSEAIDAIADGVIWFPGLEREVDIHTKWCHIRELVIEY